MGNGRLGGCLSNRPYFPAFVFSGVDGLATGREGPLFSQGLANTRHQEKAECGAPGTLPRMMAGADQNCDKKAWQRLSDATPHRQRETITLLLPSRGGRPSSESSARCSS